MGEPVATDAERGADGGPNDEPTGVHRRRLLRAGVWTAPAVLVAGAAPAYAISPKAKIYMYTFAQNGVVTEWAGPPTNANVFVSMTGTAQFSSGYDSAPVIVTAATLTLTMPVGGMDQTGTPVVVSGAGWSFASQSFSATTATYTFTWTGSVAATQQSSVLVYRLPGNRTPKANHFPKTVTGTLSGSNFDPYVATVTYN